MGNEREPAKEWLPAAVPLLAAIGIFGTIYGAGATAVGSPGEVIGSSLIVFSGALQFATVGGLLTGASTVGLVATAVMLNTRHLVLGAAVRTTLDVSRGRRAFLSWFLLDETAGLALAYRADSARVMLVSGVLAYGVWVGGTAVGVYGASLASLEDLAESIFPVLFVGLAAMAARAGDRWQRIAIAVGVTLATAIAVPDIKGLAPVIGAIVAALPEDPR